MWDELHQIRRPIIETLPFRSPLMREWAIECYNDMQILNRRGRKWVIVSYNSYSYTLQEVLTVRIPDYKTKSQMPDFWGLGTL